MDRRTFSGNATLNSCVINIMNDVLKYSAAKALSSTVFQLSLSLNCQEYVIPCIHFQFGGSSQQRKIDSKGMQVWCHSLSAARLCSAVQNAQKLCGETAYNGLWKLKGSVCLTRRTWRITDHWDWNIFCLLKLHQRSWTPLQWMAILLHETALCWYQHLITGETLSILPQMSGTCERSLSKCFYTLVHHCWTAWYKF